MIEAAWGSNPRFSDGVSYEFIRAEGKSFPSHRCLVPASEFHIRNGEKKFRAFREDGNFFYLAAAWDPPLADWPLSYRILTIPAGADVIPYQSRHGVIIQRRDANHWLDGSVPNEVLFEEPPRHTLFVEPLRKQAELPL